MSLGLTVTAISWDRVNLTLTAQLCGYEGRHVGFAIESGPRRFAVGSEPLGGGTYALTLNVTNFHDRAQIPDGEWRIVAVLDGDIASTVPAGYDLNRVSELDAASRSFIYSENTVSYLVSFGLTEGDDPTLVMRVYQMFRPPDVDSGLALGRRLLERVAPQRRRVGLANRWYQLARRLHRHTGNRILIASEMRSRMEGNLLRVHDRMIERGLDSRFEIRTSFRVPRTASKVSTLRVVYELATADIVLIDDYFGVLGALDISPETVVIQAWHAGSGFKSIGFSRFGNYGSPKLQNAHRKYTYAITGSTQLVPVYAEAFGIEESAVIPTGLPRIDTFLDPQRTEAVVADFHRSYPELAGKRRILFAPTFRGKGVRDAYYDVDRIDFGRLYELCGEHSVVMFRMHHFVSAALSIPPEYADRLIDFSRFPDTNDLLHVTDILITDYSSIIYEFSLLDRPMLFFAYDKQIYSATRGFHRDFDLTAPGKVCNDFDELVTAIETEDFELDKVAAFRKENFDVIDTHSADRVIDTLILAERPPRRT